jgi:hypothetical protein
MLRNIERIVLDECLQLTPDVVEEIERRIGHRPAEIVVVADKYASLPDLIIIERLMDARSMLMTQDRPLHNLAIDRGFASLLRTPEGGWRRDRVGPMTMRSSFPACAPSSPEDNLLPPLSAEAAVIAGLLNGFRSEKASKQLRTKRRRIRSHFGTPANIGAVALTVAQRRTERGTVGGYKLKVDSRYGTKGLFPASEGYFLDPAGREHPRRGRRLMPAARCGRYRRNGRRTGRSTAPAVLAIIEIILHQGGGLLFTTTGKTVAGMVTGGPAARAR